MRIQHNIAAMNAYRNYNTNTSAVSKNLEKLSSGYKINRTGDDAAGLAISEKMRAQISGLNAASKNVKDGISLVKTAEGAMQEVQDMLNRMVTLSTQSANGTYDNEVDRANLQKEVDQLRAEINRIADSSNFNGIKLLDGSQGITTTYQMSSPAVEGADEAFEIVADGQLGVASQAGVFSFDLSQLRVVTPAGGGNAAAGEGTKAEYEIDLTGWKAGDSITVNGTAIAYNDGAAEFANVTVDGYDVSFANDKLTLTAKTAGAIGESGPAAAVTYGGTVAGTAVAANTDATEITAGAEAEGDAGAGTEAVAATYDSGTVTAVNNNSATDTLTIGGYDVTIDTTQVANQALDAQLNAFVTAYNNDAANTDWTASLNDAGDGILFTAKEAGSLDTTGATAPTGTTVVTEGKDAETAAAGGKVTYALTLGSNEIYIELDENTTYTGADLAQKVADVLNGKTPNAVPGGTAEGAEAVAATYDSGTVTAVNNNSATDTLTIGGYDVTIDTTQVANQALDAQLNAFVTAYNNDAANTDWTASLNDAGDGILFTAKEAGSLDTTGATAPTGTTVVTEGKDAEEGGSTTAGFSLGGVSFTAVAKSGVLTITMDEAPTQQWDSAQNDNLSLEFHDVPSGTVNNGGEQFKATVLTEPIDTTRQRQYAQATLDLNKLNLKDGASIQIGDTTYTFAIGADSRFKNAANVIDLTDKTMANFSADDNSGVKAAANRLSKVAASNGMFYVGSDTNGKISLTEKEGAVDYTKNNLAGSNNNGTAGKPDGKDATVNDWKGLIKTGQASISGSGLTLQIGDTSESYNQLIVNIGDIHTKALGIDNIDISTQAGAQSAVNTIKDAINSVSSIRGTLGATQNRLEHTANNLSVMAENIQDAESTIRDTDVAEEMMSYTKNNILVQSAQAMLAQANQIPQGVLQLLG